MAEPTPRYRVLLVVRDPMERTSLAQLLEPDFELESTGTGAQALTLLQARPFEVLLIEQNLEGGTGLEVAAEVAALPGSISCILLAEKDEDVSVPQRSNASLLTVVVKPWHAARLARLLEQSARLTLARRAAEALS